MTNLPIITTGHLRVLSELRSQAPRPAWALCQTLGWPAGAVLGTLEELHAHLLVSRHELGAMEGTPVYGWRSAAANGP